MAAIDELNALLASLPGYALLTNDMKNRALEGAVVPDSNGVWPGGEDYVPTYDVYYAAISLIGFLQAQPVVRQSSSEGTSVAVDAPNWTGLVAWYSSMSLICSAQPGGGLLKPVAIPDGPHVVRRDMSGRGDGYGDVDTDLG